MFNNLFLCVILKKAFWGKIVLNIQISQNNFILAKPGLLFILEMKERMKIFISYRNEEKYKNILRIDIF